MCPSFHESEEAVGGSDCINAQKPCLSLRQQSFRAHERLCSKADVMNSHIQVRGHFLPGWNVSKMSQEREGTRKLSKDLMGLVVTVSSHG